MTDPANNDAALVRKARMEAKGLRDARPGWKKMADLLDRLAAAAERADEAEQLLQELHAEVEMAESVGICLRDRVPSLRARDFLARERK